MKKFLLTFFTIALIAGLAGGYYVYTKVKNYGKTALHLTEEMIFTLPAGTGRVALEALIQEKKLITDTRPFQFYLRLYPELSHFKAGTYRLTPQMTINDLLMLLKSGKEAQFSIQFIEGTRFKDWFLVVKQTPYLKHELPDSDLETVQSALAVTEHPEGWFYPDTYKYTAETTDIALLNRAHKRMKETLNKLWEERDEDLPYKSAYEMLIMASIIEKETAVEAERSKVASVFINRLRLGMKLQTDPTVIYGMGENYKGNITRKDLTTETPYNTYVINGLPPTPIAMPGLASLQAAAHPAKTNFLYFVADGNGGHTFSTNLNSHNQAVREYIKIQRQKRER